MHTYTHRDIFCKNVIMCLKMKNVFFILEYSKHIDIKN